MAPNTTEQSGFQRDVRLQAGITGVQKDKNTPTEDILPVYTLENDPVYARTQAQLRQQALLEVAQKVKKERGKHHVSFGIGFWIILGFAGLKDMADIAINLSVFLTPFISFLSILLSGTIFSYLLFGAQIKPSTQKALFAGVGTTLEMLPWGSMLPLYTIGLLFLYITEQKK